jgi:flagellar biosynthesis chaperone FliJ
MRLRRNVQKRLADLRHEIMRVKENLRVLDEQVAHAEDVADEAATRAVVASNPLADRERRAAAEDLRRVRRERDETAARLASLLDEQDRLLERLAAGTR